MTRSHTIFCFLIFIGCSSTLQTDEYSNNNLISEPILKHNLFQNPCDKLDSLLYISEISTPDTNLVNIYTEIGYLYQSYDFEKAEEYYLKADSLSEKLDWNKGRRRATNYRGMLLCKQELYDSAIILIEKGLEFAKKENNETSVASTYAYLGSNYLLKEWYETALEYYFKSLSIYEKSGDEFQKAHIYDLLGATYIDLNRVDEAIQYGKKAVDIYEKKPDNIKRANALINLANSCYFKNLNEEAEKNYKEALRICKIHNHRYNISNIYVSLGRIALCNHDLDMAERYTRDALKIYSEINGLSDYYYAIILLGWIEEVRGDFSKAEKYVREALEIAIRNNSLKAQMDCYRTLSELCIAQRDFKNRWVYTWKIDSLEQIQAMENFQRTADEIHIKYETSKKELEIEKQRQIIKNQFFHRNLLVGGISLSVIIIILLWYLLRLRKRHNQMLTEINATKDKFFSIISHDLRNPAIAQRDAIQQLLKNANLWNKEELSLFCSHLLKSADEEVELLHTLLSWAQIQTGRMSYVPITFDLPANLQTDISLIRNMAEFKKITLIDNMPKQAQVTGDINMIITVVRNLLTNAVKFTQIGGEISLTIESSANDKIKVSVHDTGTGMSSEQMKNLFNLDCLRSNKGTIGEQSSGLGLIVCQELLKKHGSTLHVESEEGKGSTFWFEI